MKSGPTAQPVFHLIVEITDEDARHDINDIMLRVGGHAVYR